MKYYAVIDTNVLVSAMLRWDSVPGCVLEHAFIGDIIPLLNGQVLKEYIEVLRRPKFHFDEETLPPEYYDWTSITIEELKLVPVINIYLSKENTVSNSVTLETTTKQEKPKRTYKKKKVEDKIDTIPDT